MDDSIQIISDSVSSISQSTGKTKNNTGSNPDNNTAGNDSTSAGEIAAMAMGAAAIHEAVPDTAYETDGTDISDNTDSVQSFEAAEEEAAADTSGDSFAAKERQCQIHRKIIVLMIQPQRIWIMGSFIR